MIKYHPMNQSLFPTIHVEEGLTLPDQINSTSRLNRRVSLLGGQFCNKNLNSCYDVLTYSTPFRCDTDSESGSSTENDSQQNSPITNDKCQRTGYPSGYHSEEL